MPINVEDIKREDVIRAEHDSTTRLATEYRARYDQDAWNDAANSLYFLLSRPVVLPTEPGVYLDKEGDVWHIDGRGGRLICISTTVTTNGAEFAPFTLLRPVPEVAAEIADYFDGPEWQRSWGTIGADIRSKWGVTQ